MDIITIIQSIVMPVLGLLGISTIVYLITKWLIEKKRIRFNRRLSLIKKCKKIASRKDFSRHKFIYGSEYSTIKLYLSKELIRKLEFDGPTSKIKGCENNPAALQLELAKEVIQIEQKWKLI